MDMTIPLDRWHKLVTQWRNKIQQDKQLAQPQETCKRSRLCTWCNWFGLRQVYIAPEGTVQGLLL